MNTHNAAKSGDVGSAIALASDLDFLGFKFGDYMGKRVFASLAEFTMSDAERKAVVRLVEDRLLARHNKGLERIRPASVMNSQAWA